MSQEEETQTPEQKKIAELEAKVKQLESRDVPLVIMQSQAQQLADYITSDPKIASAMKVVGLLQSLQPKE